MRRHRRTGAACCDRRCARATSVSDGTGFVCRVIDSKLRALSKESAQFFKPTTPTTKKPDTAKPSPGRRPLAEGPRCGIGRSESSYGGHRVSRAPGLSREAELSVCEKDRPNGFRRRRPQVSCSKKPGSRRRVEPGLLIGLDPTLARDPMPNGASM